MLSRHVHRMTTAAVLCMVLLVPIHVAAGAQSASAAAERGQEHCHDLAYPELTCYSTAAERDAAFTTGGDGAAALSSGYVIAYLHASYAGSSVILSQDYGNLGFIGWSDKISSYRVYTSPTGYFHEHTWYGGRAQAYCCFSSVAYVGDALNDTFSSFNLP